LKIALRLITALILIAAFLSLISALVWLLPNLLVDPYRSQMTAVERAKATSDARTSLVALFAGLAAFAGLIFSARSYLVNRSSSYADRYGRAVTQLADETHLGVRLGGIYALESLAAESRRDRSTIAAVLSAFVRTSKPTDENAEPDVQAAVCVLGRGQLSKEAADLRGANLAGLILSKVSLRGADLRDVDLGMSDLRMASLDKCDLTGADLRGANLEQCSLRGAILSKVDARGSIAIADANLTDAVTTDLRLS